MCADDRTVGLPQFNRIAATYHKIFRHGVRYARHEKAASPFDLKHILDFGEQHHQVRSCIIERSMAVTWPPRARRGCRVVRKSPTRHRQTEAASIHQKVLSARHRRAKTRM